MDGSILFSLKNRRFKPALFDGANCIAGRFESFARNRKDDDLRRRLARLRAELDEARRAVAELTARNSRLSEESTRLRQERDLYLKSLHAMTRKDFSFTAEELQELDRTGGSLDGLIKELEEARGN